MFQAGYSDCFAVKEVDKPVSYHRSVMPLEVLELLSPHVGGRYLDCTLGGAGHTKLLLEKGGCVVAVDKDPEALAHAKPLLQSYPTALTLVQGDFREADRHPLVVAAAPFHGILMDIGVSSHQIDEARRGFSFMKEGPLDMRMGGEGESAANLVNERSEEELRRIFRDFGEEPQAGRIAALLVERRRLRHFDTTQDLAETIERAIGRRGAKHPATKVFQALRIAVNDELEALREGLARLSGLLERGGRLAVISFHSLEDRIVKHFFRSRSAEWIDDPSWPAARRNPDRCFQLLTRKALEPTCEEIKDNPRARSARLRVVEKL